MILIPHYRAMRRASGLDLLSNLILSLDLEEASGNATDSSGNSYTFTDTNTVGQTTGQTAGYNSRQFVAANTEYFTRAHSTTELTIGDNEWAAHMWVYNNSVANNAILFAKTSSTTISTNVSRSFALYQPSSTNRNLTFVVGDAGNVAQYAVTTGNSEFPDASWSPILIWHDPNDDVIGIKVGANSAVTTSISGGVRNGTVAATIAANSAGAALANCNIAALRIWRGSGVIAQIVDNADAIDFLNAQQRRHSDLT